MTKKKNYCDANGICTARAVNVDLCRFYERRYPDMREQCAHEIPIGDMKYVCNSAKALKIAKLKGVKK